MSSLAEKVRQVPTEDTAIVQSDGTTVSRTTYGQLSKMVQHCRSMLTEWQVSKGSVVGICGPNTAQWVAWDIAAATDGVRLMPFPTPMTGDDASQMMQDYDLALFLIAADSETSLLPPGVVGLDSVGHGQARSVVGRWADLNDDVHSLIFSSGTGGVTKGLEVSWRGTDYVVSRFVKDYDLHPGDVNLVFIPFTSYQQRLSVYAALASGSAVALTSYERVFATMKTVEPTFVIGPPVFFETLLKLATARDPHAGIRESTGSRMRFMVTGMAPIKQSTIQAFWDQGRPLLEAYGMNESGMIAWNTPQSYRFGTVGHLLDTDHVAITDGELLVTREFPLSRRYFQAEPQVAAMTFHDDGTIASGDLASIDDDGFVTLHGRVGDLIALPNGEKVSPSDVETAYAGVRGLSDIVVCAGGAGRRLVGVVTLGEGATLEEVRAALTARGSSLPPGHRIGNLLHSERSPREDSRFLTANLKLSRVALQRFVSEELHR